MRYLDQKPSALWWTGNIRYFIYFVREVAGIILGLTTFVMLASAIAMLFLGSGGHRTGFFIMMDLVEYFIYILFGASIIHTITWLHAMPRIMPFTLSKNGQKIVYLILLAFWIGISWLAMVTLFAPKSYV
jgi:fumarate reductase subunit C